MEKEWALSISREAKMSTVRRRRARLSLLDCRKDPCGAAPPMMSRFSPHAAVARPSPLATFRSLLWIGDIVK